MSKTQNPLEALFVRVALGATGKELEDMVVAGHQATLERIAAADGAKRGTKDTVDLGTDHPKQRGQLLVAIADATGVDAEYEGTGKNARRGVVHLKGERPDVDWAKAVYAILFKDAAIRSGAKRADGTTRQTALTEAIEDLTDRLVPRLAKAASKAGVATVAEAKAEVAA
jgi:hypothetical protein